MTFTIVHLLPELLGTYGDRGNVDVLSWRLAQRNIPHDVLTVGVHDEIPQTADLYLLGGGEDDAQIAAKEILDRQGVMRKAINRGAHIFAVCAGFQLLGSKFPASGDREIAGLGILPIETVIGAPRSVGELLTSATIGSAGGLPEVMSRYRVSNLVRFGMKGSKSLEATLAEAVSAETGLRPRAARARCRPSRTGRFQSSTRKQRPCGRRRASPNRRA